MLMNDLAYEPGAEPSPTPNSTPIAEPSPTPNGVTSFQDHLDAAQAELATPSPEAAPSPVASAPAPAAAPEPHKSFWEKVGDVVTNPHTLLGIGSFAPSFIGSGFSAADGALYAVQGDKVNAGISFAAAGVGLVSDAGAARLAGKAIKATVDLAEGGADAAKVIHAGETGEVAVDAIRAERALAEPVVSTADIDAFRAKIGVPDANTVGVARTNVPALENETFEGASIIPRRQGEMGPTTEGPIESPNAHPLSKDHAEQDIANQFIAAVDKAGLKPADLDGKELTMRIQNEQGICTTCKQGLTNPAVPPGVLKQLSERYPGLTIHVVVDNPGPAMRGSGDFRILNGTIVK